MFVVVVRIFVAVGNVVIFAVVDVRIFVVVRMFVVVIFAVVIFAVCNVCL